MDDIELGIALLNADRSVAAYVSMSGSEQDFETRKVATADSLIYLKGCISSLDGNKQKELKRHYDERFKSLMKKIKEKDKVLLKEYEDVETVGTIVEIS